MTAESASPKVAALAEAVAWRRRLAAEGKKVVFTNGCFDLIHRGHVELLRAARREGDALVVGMNGDSSVRRLKGPTRPLVPEGDRAEVLAALEMVDRVVLFDDDTPARLVEALLPDVLVKGADWAQDAIVGREAVEGAGGRVVRVPLAEGRSTRSLVRTILERCAGDSSAAKETP
ncbi:MAG: D-glycero-beta-D-manno-heptose 1-phosphate adenylyltransferase [bacterium]